MFIFFILLFFISPSSLITLKLPSEKFLSSSHLYETLKLTLTISPETHHLSSSSSQADAVLTEARPTAVPAIDRLRPSRPSRPSLSDHLSACSPINAASPDPRRHQCCFTRPTPPIGAASPDPRRHQCCFTRPTPPIKVLAL